MHSPLKILVVDDTEANLTLISKAVSQMGHQAITARNGYEAVSSFRADAPDLILMDVMMPEMDGYEATAKIKELSGTKWVPVIFLSAKGQDIDQAKGLAIGGDDYLTKPVNLLVLSQKIRAMQRIAALQRKTLDYSAQLERYREQMEDEQHLAKFLLDKIIRTDQIDNELVQHWILPASKFSGDIIVTAHTPGGVLHVILADGTGHGLSAAINVLPVIEAFYGMTEKGFSISSIVQELNRKIKQIMPTERFVAATVASINFTDCTINIWNGGGPDAFFVDNDGKVLRTWKSLNPALGILSNDQFDNRTETFQWPEDGQFFMCSDGLIEAENANREAYGKARLVNVLSSIPRQERFSSVVQSIKQHLGGAISSDDISLIAVDCVKNRAETSEPKHAVEPPVATSPTQRSLWKLNLTLTSEELRSFDALPVIMGWLDQLKLSQKERGEVYTILAELFSNALDHGVLELDSSLKNQSDGFDRYMDQRSARLASLQNGQIEIGFECQQHGEIKFLRLLVKDSGKGFDVQHRLSVDISGNTGLAGRGIALVKSLTTDLEYRGNGNEAIAFYRLD